MGIIINYPYETMRVKNIQEAIIRFKRDIFIDGEIVISCQG